MDQISLLTPVLITHNWKQATTELVFYLKAVDHIIEGSKIQIFIPRSFTLSPDFNCLYDGYIEAASDAGLSLANEDDGD